MMEIKFVLLFDQRQQPFSVFVLFVTQVAVPGTNIVR